MVKVTVLFLSYWFIYKAVSLSELLKIPLISSLNKSSCRKIVEKEFSTVTPKSIVTVNEFELLNVNPSQSAEILVSEPEFTEQSAARAF